MNGLQQYLDVIGYRRQAYELRDQTKVRLCSSVFKSHLMRCGISECTTGRFVMFDDSRLVRCERVLTVGISFSAAIDARVTGKLGPHPPQPVAWS